MTADRLVIRPPVVLRVYGMVFGAVWLGLVGFAAVAGFANGAGPVIVIPLAMFAFGSFIVSSNLRMRVIADGDALQVRNFLRDERFPRSTIARFVEHAAGGVSSRLGGTVAVLPHDGRLVDLRATASGPFGRSRRAELLDALQHWLVR